MTTITDLIKGLQGRPHITGTSIQDSFELRDTVDVGLDNGLSWDANFSEVEPDILLWSFYDKDGRTASVSSYQCSGDVAADCDGVYALIMSEYEQYSSNDVLATRRYDRDEFEEACRKAYDTEPPDSSDLLRLMSVNNDPTATSQLLADLKEWVSDLVMDRVRDLIRDALADTSSSVAADESTRTTLKNPSIEAQQLVVEDTESDPDVYIDVASASVSHARVR